MTRKPRSGKSHLPLDPQRISNIAWFYFEKHGLTILHQIYIKGTFIRIDKNTIPNKLLNKVYRLKS